MQHILVTGGAGRLGRLIVKQLSAAGYPVRGMSRRARPGDDWPGAEWKQADLETGAGLAEAVQGIDVVIHAATGGNHHTWRIDVEGTGRLLDAAREAGVSHVVYITLKRSGPHDPHIHGEHVITLINVFIVDPTHQQRLVELLTRATEVSVRYAPGFVSASLHRSTDGTKVTMYAQWRSVEASKTIKPCAKTPPLFRFFRRR
jgi:NAD(P)-dependent dehydrogenase (short-subunit alcohol dehydrogenase family)